MADSRNKNENKRTAAYLLVLLKPLPSRIVHLLGLPLPPSVWHGVVLCASPCAFSPQFYVGSEKLNMSHTFIKYIRQTVESQRQLHASRQCLQDSTVLGSARLAAAAPRVSPPYLIGSDWCIPTRNSMVDSLSTTVSVHLFACSLTDEEPKDTQRRV